MRTTPATPGPIATASLFTESQNVITKVRGTVQWPHLLDAKLVNQGNGPIPDKTMAEVYGIPLSSIRTQLAAVTLALARTDQQCGSPLG